MASKTKPTKEVQTVFGDEKIVNTPTMIADAIIKLLTHRGLDYYEVELRRWCEFDFQRRHGRWMKEGSNFQPPPVSGTTIAELTRKYLGNWYKTHMKWKRANGG